MDTKDNGAFQTGRKQEKVTAVHNSIKTYKSGENDECYKTNNWQSIF